MKHVLFLTSNNLATNPRLVKEIELARRYYKCTVFYFHLANWSDPIDITLRNSLKGVNFYILPASNKYFLPWLISSIFEKFSKFLYPFIKRNLFINALAHSKRSFLICLALHKYKNKVDFIIAHNLPALYPVYWFAKSRNIPFAFDIEDFHPGEKINNDIENEKARREYLIKRILPYSHYFSYASPLIGTSIIDSVPHIYHQKHFLINNSFSIKEFKLPLSNESKKLSFIWFSQNVAAGRGLETFIPILYDFRDDVELTLIGNLNKGFNSYISEYSEIINFIEPLSQAALHKLLANFDVGLAIESASNDLNRDLCLTNKIFAYAQAGLYVLATNTKGQTQFIEQNPWIGGLIGDSSKDIRSAVRSLIKGKKNIRENASKRYSKSRKLAWEYEQEKLIDAWKTLK
jgi:hypothetical protein